MGRLADYASKSSIFIEVDDLLTTGRKTFQASTLEPDEPEKGDPVVNP